MNKFRVRNSAPYYEEIREHVGKDAEPAFILAERIHFYGTNLRETYVAQTRIFARYRTTELKPLQIRSVSGKILRPQSVGPKIAIRVLLQSDPGK